VVAGVRMEGRYWEYMDVMYLSETLETELLSAFLKTGRRRSDGDGSDKGK
jgi:hypothetical protein